MQLPTSLQSLLFSFYSPPEGYESWYPWLEVNVEPDPVRQNSEWAAAVPRHFTEDAIITMLSQPGVRLQEEDVLDFPAWAERSTDLRELTDCMTALFRMRQLRRGTADADLLLAVGDSIETRVIKVISRYMKSALEAPANTKSHSKIAHALSILEASHSE